METFPPAPSPAGLSAQPPCASVLVVDDHPGVRTGLTLLIDTERPRLCSAGAAASAAQALEMARRLRPALVLLDVDLAGEDGLALIAPMRRDTGCAVVVLSSAATPGVRARALALGAHACLCKTVPAAELLECLRAAAPANVGGELSCPKRSEHPVAPGRSSDGASRAQA
ncbi:response regulator [Azohydromonas aeria]|uniref:response regulator n=1 Tax=Azohydromonas aeria TaxID=2590212 RepID=UPI0012FA4FD0|nr:response regulator transcription factor [Azohydromonas aeria]